jgi:hypothetical protein
MKERVIPFMLLPLLIFISLEAQQPEAIEIMIRSRDLTLTGSMSADIHMSITEKKGSSRYRSIEMTAKEYQDGQEKRFIKFLEPSDVRGTSMLIIDNKNIADEMWIYLPALKKTRRIVSSEKGKSFMSSEFSNADMSSPTITDFRYKHLEQSGSSNQWIIESIPVNDEKADEYGYTRKISYISIDRCQVLKMDFYNFDNELYKTIVIKGVYPLKEGKFIVKNMEANNLLSGRNSVIEMTNIAVGGQVDDSVFSLQNLER